MRIFLFIALFLFSLSGYSQKKPLDHSVYDGWQNISERLISDNGNYISFTVTPQEGDGQLFIKKKDGSLVAEIARGYNANITDNSQFLICRIKPFFKDTRDAKIKKKRPEEMPKDSLAIVSLATGSITKIAQIKSFKIADEQAYFLAYHLEKKPAAPAPRAGQIDSTTKPTASVAPTTPRAAADPFEEGTDLVVKNLLTGDTVVYKLVSEYFFNKKGNILLIETTKKTGDPKVKSQVVRVDLLNKQSAIVFAGFNDAKSYRMDESGNQLAFIAERDSSAKSLQKFYKLYYHKAGADSAVLLAQKNTNGMPTDYTISENAQAINFSKSGKRLFFGTAPILPVRDTLTPEFERVSVDVWHYKDDYLQPLQLRTLQQELNRAYLARFDFEKGSVVQLGTPAFRTIQQTNDGDGAVFYALADEGKRIASQWQGGSFSDIYTIDPITGIKRVIQKDIKGNTYPSSTGKYLVIYDDVKRKYSTYSTETQKISALAADIKQPLFDVENDVPDDPNPYGIVGWIENDAALLLYDQFDIWQVDPLGMKASINITGSLGRKNNLVFRNINLDREERSIKPNQLLLLNVFNRKNKGSGLKSHLMGTVFEINNNATLPVRISGVIKAKDAAVISFGTETFERSANIAVIDWNPNSLLSDLQTSQAMHQPNPQQAQYNWGTVELFTWKSYTGRIAEGLVYKPEDFDPKKKYPMIAYFYERSSDGLYGYNAPAPTPSRLNIPFFVSRGYIVFVPDIWYKTGYPGQGAYDYIVSGTRALVAKGYVDSTKLGLQGQSWGGYQIAHLITRTNLYAAAWAGAPVANMTSAYGGIRWGSGLNRQFQYEKTQSRIGATLWEKPNLYIENSPLFHFPKVKTPVVIMHNDADGAVPWYQGIEMFTALRRLGKPVWMLNYNNEDHNLVERRNRKDIQIREQQFFDYLLKGDKPAKWIAEGVPAILKGRDWGLGY